MTITGHSLPLVSLGGFILIMGFMAFNGGSQASISQPGDGLAIGRAVQVGLEVIGLLYKQGNCSQVGLQSDSDKDYRVLYRFRPPWCPAGRAGRPY